MAKSMTASAGEHNIRVNVIAPSALTRMAPGGGSVDMDPTLVAPMAAFLAHEACPVSGEVYLAGAGRFARIFVAATEGYVPADATGATIDDVAAHWDAINDESGYYVPANLMDWAAHYLAHRA
jgi:hypothetical protein